MEHSLRATEWKERLCMGVSSSQHAKSSAAVQGMGKKEGMIIAVAMQKKGGRA